METIRLNLKLHSRQQKFLDNQARFRAFISGIGGGKTYIGCLTAILIALKYPNSMGIIVAPTYGMLRDSTQRTFLELLPEELISAFQRSANELTLTNGSSILFRSADDPEKLRGANLGWFYMDEASVQATDMAWKILIGRLRKAPELGWITTTPKGFNWVYDTFVAKKRPDYWYESFATSENPFLSKDYIESVLEGYDGKFLRQEFYGEFVAFEGLVYPQFGEGHILRELPPTGKIKRIECGIDWGFVNPSVAVFAGFDNDDNMYVLEEIYESKLEIETFIARVTEVADRLNWTYGKKCEAYYCDPSEPMFIKKFNDNGLLAYEARNEIIGGISEVSRRLGKNQLFFYQSCFNLINELRQYHYPETKEGKQLKENPVKFQDHAVDALRYLCMGQDRGELALVTRL